VLAIYPNDDHTYSLYVTDYTVNKEIQPVTATWCDPLLADRVLKVEMWNNAAEYARSMMRAGDYYFLGNNRMKISGNGYVVGTMSEDEKIRKLDEAEEERHPLLQDLLR